MIACLWAFPLTAAGWLLHKLTKGRKFGYAANAVVYLAGPRIVRWMEKRGVAAFTWGRTIIARNWVFATDRRVISHELVHVGQAERWGVFLPLAYVVASLIALVRGKEAYRDNAFEAEAYKKERP